MLNDDPPPGIRVRLLRDTNLAKALSIATLVSPQGRHLTERSDDQFQIEYRGQYITVRRDEIEEA